jgi:hypothetical protein
VSHAQTRNSDPALSTRAVHEYLAALDDEAFAEAVDFLSLALPYQ